MDYPDWRREGRIPKRPFHLLHPRPKTSPSGSTRPHCSRQKPTDIVSSTHQIPQTISHALAPTNAPRPISPHTDAILELSRRNSHPTAPWLFPRLSGEDRVYFKRAEGADIVGPRKLRDRVET